jgi:hypothetical protein
VRRPGDARVRQQETEQIHQVIAGALHRGQQLPPVNLKVDSKCADAKHVTPTQKPDTGGFVWTMTAPWLSFSCAPTR